jgi:two-component system OmpR family sensor kinase
MQLTKAESGSLFSENRHNLISVLAFIVDEYQRLFAQRTIHLELPKGGVFMSGIDADAFAILVRNLVENALKHGALDQAVNISFSADGILRIVNGGNSIPKEKLARLRQHFFRSNTATQGTGLGLAIADALVDGIGASMTLHSPATGRADGFEVIVRF